MSAMEQAAQGWAIGARVRHVSGGPSGVIFDWFADASPYYRKKFALREPLVWVAWPPVGPHSESRIGYTPHQAEKNLRLVTDAGPSVVTLEATHFAPLLKIVRDEKERHNGRHRNGEQRVADLFREIEFRLSNAQKVVK